jgi:four helix bundle protein
MRDHRKLKAFELADALVIETYRVTKTWPREELFGLTAQVRRATVSIASNLVEGCSRNTQREYSRFIEVAFGSCREALYQLSVARRLEMNVGDLEARTEECCRILSGLLKSQTSSLKPQASS